MKEPKKRPSPLQRLALKPQSSRLSINAKCYQCMGEDADPGWINRIRNCNTIGCALHNVRPFRPRKPANEEAPPPEEASSMVHEEWTDDDEELL